MAKRRIGSDRTLEKYRTEWRKSRKKITLSKALAYHIERRIAEPAWLHDAVYNLGRKLIMGMKKTGRSTNLMLDDSLYMTVYDYLNAGLSQEKAFASAARDYFDELNLRRRKDKDGTRGEDFALTVKAAWLRHKKRIVKEDGEFGSVQFYYPWRIKKKYIEQDKDARWYSKGLNPPPRRTKNK